MRTSHNTQNVSLLKSKDSSSNEQSRHYDRNLLTPRTERAQRGHISAQLVTSNETTKLPRANETSSNSIADIDTPDHLSSDYEQLD